ncbi:hypothetical protein ACIQU6_31985 [Streptomyces sp. NPDC090442]|uniref:hypothetical protein n=1 Tax=Streptomyces sp. NPDC090442 TaxID=3365962 RepID=UPI003802E37D
MSLADTAALASDGPTDDRPSGREVLTASIAAIEDRIAHLRAAQGLLEHLQTCPKADPVRECAPLRAELDRDVAEGLAGLSAPDGRPSRRAAPPVRAPRPPR